MSRTWQVSVYFPYVHQLFYIFQPIRKVISTDVPGFKSGKYVQVDVYIYFLVFATHSNISHFLGHSGPVVALGFSNDESLLASADEKNQIIIWRKSWNWIYWPKYTYITVVNVVVISNNEFNDKILPLFFAEWKQINTYLNWITYTCSYVPILISFFIHIWKWKNSTS